MYHIFYKLFKFLGFSFLLVLASIIQAQTPRIDSLKQVLSSQEGISRFDALYELAFEYIDIDNSMALQYADEAESIGLSFGDSAKIVKGGLVKGYALRKLERLDLSIEKFRKTLAIAQRNKFKSETKYLLNSLANGYTFKADYDNALDYHFQSLVIREQDGDKSEISISLMNIN